MNPKQMKQTKVVHHLPTTAAATTASAATGTIPGRAAMMAAAAVAATEATANATLLPRKTSIKSSKFYAKLDRKSSRGMIYENEELRLRTININAEVERGQSDIKRLKKENELLRREIWTLRDECDRLSKKVKAKFSERPRGGCPSQKGCHCHCRDGAVHNQNAECHDNENCENGGCDALHHTKCSTAEESETCNGDCCYIHNEADVDGDEDGVEDGDCDTMVNSAERDIKDLVNHYNNDESVATDVAEECNGGDMSEASRIRGEQHKILGGLLKTFDHLSVVSEETLSNGSQSVLPSLVRPLTPLTPVDVVATELNELQAAGPPLSYFENILQQHMNNKIETSSDCYSNLKRSSEHTNNWDRNLKSPFSPKVTTQNPLQPACYPLSRAIMQPPLNSAEVLRFPQDSDAIHNESVKPKHFFAPLKPQLRINTTLANQNRQPPCVTDSPSCTSGRSSDRTASQYDFGPPDIYVTNALASPWHDTILRARTSMKYHRPVLDVQAKTNVSRTLLKRKRKHRGYRRIAEEVRKHSKRHHQLRQAECPLDYASNQLNPLRAKLFRTNKTNNLDINILQPPRHMLYNTLCMHPRKPSNSSLTAALVSCNTLNLQLLPLHMQSNLTNAACSTKPATNKTNKNFLDLSDANEKFLTNCYNFNNISKNISKPHDPVYAIAQKSCDHLITASAVTKPLMATTSNSSNVLINSTILPYAHTTPSLLVSASALAASCCQLTLQFPQTLNTNYQKPDSVNLETLLNDIEAMSEGILSLQLEKTNNESNGQSIKNINEINDKSSYIGQLQNKTTKPYKSEMNLLLTYENDMPTIRPIKLNTAGPSKIASPTTILLGDTGSSCTSTLRRTRSLEAEQQQCDYSPPPNMPDPMLPFPDNRAYNLRFNALTSDNDHHQMTSTPSTPSTTTIINSLEANDHVGEFLPSATKSSAALFNTKLKTTIRSVSVQNTKNTSTSSGDGSSPTCASDKYPLNNAKMKRALFRTSPTHRIHSNERPTEAHDANSPVTEEADTIHININSIGDDASNPTKHKEQRVPDTMPPDYSLVVEGSNVMAMTATTAPAIASGSCCDLPTVLPNQNLGRIKQTSHSTPNSPHSTRKYDESTVTRNVIINTNTTSVGSVALNANQMMNVTDVDENIPKQQQQQQQQQHLHQLSYPNQVTQGVIRNKGNKQDAMRAAASDMICAAANVVHTKCLRRHSDGTLIHSANTQRAVGASVSNGLTVHTNVLPTIQLNSQTQSQTQSQSQPPSHLHSHSHNRTHHRQHQQWHNNRSHHHQPNGTHGSQCQDSQHDMAATSYSDHSNSNCSNFSHESSSSSSTTSSHYSQRSQRRKLSISSHTAGKIPWCGCWGNGCL